MPELERRRLTVEEELVKPLAVRRPLKGSSIQRPSIVFGPEIKPRIQHEFTMGRIYLGYVYFHDGRKPVIIKEIDWNKETINTGNVLLGNNGVIDTVIAGMKEIFARSGLVATPDIISREYNGIIIKLRNSGIRLPKMKAIVLDGRLLIISEYFGNSKGRKLIKDVNEVYTNPNLLSQALSICKDLINNGFVPTHDLIELFTLKDGTKTVMPLDIDLQVYYALKEKFKQSDFKSDVVSNLERILRPNEQNIQIIAEFIKNINDREIQHKLINELLRYKNDAEFIFYYSYFAKELGLDLARHLLTYIDLEKWPGLENYYNRLLTRVNDDQLELFKK